ncbi:general receptor for phosphoinositides 1-associated scaffold protein [Synchiropus splendidus]|uniref:general receptor for phosphoinositides 1-associated scaffold protein n=1 Tax=Synchiropus splendidus TaxID=270530 RepID=UPI00237DBDE5|nr:general receptor for phosphoinositides 1-associated scaffold protein [Synchiropus splendidus]
MTLRRLRKVNSSSGGTEDVYFPSSRSDSSAEVYNYRTLAFSGGTLPRSCRKGDNRKWKPSTPSPEPQRKSVTLEKNEDETFGFEIQTYGLHHPQQSSLEMCTFVCKVHEDSPAHRAGLKVGDTIAGVNEAAVDGLRHKEIVHLIRSCGNFLRLETLYSDAIRRAELEARLQFLKQTLHEKWDEYRTLTVQEQRLVHGETLSLRESGGGSEPGVTRLPSLSGIVMSDAAIYESLESAGVYGSLGAPSPVVQRAVRCTGGSSSSSLQSTNTEDDPLYQTCLYPAQPLADPKKKRRLRPASELFATARTQLTRSASTRSYVRPSSAAGEKSATVGSLQRKHKSFRRRILKFIPGLNRQLEEEESKL